MKKIYFDYLDDEDRDNPPYKAVKNELKNINLIKIDSKQELINKLSALNTNEDSLMISFFTHGHELGINNRFKVSLCKWDELARVINSIRTNNELILNLTAVCKSDRIIQSKEKFGKRIDKIWVTTDNTSSIKKSILASRHQNLSDFIHKLDEDEIELYKEII